MSGPPGEDPGWSKLHAQMQLADGRAAEAADTNKAPPQGTKTPKQGNPSKQDNWNTSVSCKGGWEAKKEPTHCHAAQCLLAQKRLSPNSNSSE